MNAKVRSFHAATVFCAAMSGGCAAKDMYAAAAGWVVAMLIWQWLMHNEIDKTVGAQL